MKYQDLMLDRACGEACQNEIYRQEAIGKINTANAIFNMESKIAELPSDDFECVQEAASVGLPTDKAGATQLSCEAIKEQLTAFYDLIISTARKVKDTSDKNMKLLIAFGKKNGISNSTNIKEFASAIAEKFSGASFSDRKFIKGKYSMKTAKAYAKGMVYLLGGYGIDITSNFDDVIKEVVGDAGKACDVKTLRCVEDKLSDGGKLLNTEKLTSRDLHYTAKVKTSDLVDLILALYTVLNVSKIIADVAGKNKKAAISTMNQCCDDTTMKERKITRSCKNINDDIKDWTANLSTVVDSIATAFGDSVYAINEAPAAE